MRILHMDHPDYHWHRDGSNTICLHERMDQSVCEHMEHHRHFPDHLPRFKTAENEDC